MRPRQMQVTTAKTFSAGAAFSLELSPVPMTITEMWVVVRANITTTTATNFNDYYDRIISSMSLSANNVNRFSFTDLRAPYHMSRMLGYAPRRPTVVPNSSTTVDVQFAYCFHFGVAPWRTDAAGTLRRNPFDLTAGIPPTGTSNLTLTGTWGAAASPGTNVTVNASGGSDSGTTQFDVYLYGVAPDSRDAPYLYQPKALPIWSMETLTMDATSTAFAKSHSVPIGDFLYAAMHMVTNGSNAPRDDAVLSSLQLYQDAEARPIWTFGGQTNIALDAVAGQIITQNQTLKDLATSDNVGSYINYVTAVPGVPDILHASDAGLYFFPMTELTWGGHPLYGVDMRTISEGVLKWKYGYLDVTGTTHTVTNWKYQLNPQYQPPVVAKKAA